VRRPHGLAGEVSVDPLTDFPERFRSGASLLWCRDEEERPLVIASVRPHAARWLLRFEGIDDATAAARLAGGELAVSEEDAVPAPEGFFYSHAIRGWRCEDREGRLRGIVESLERTAAGPLLTVATPGGREALVPFVEGIVVSIDEPARRIVLDPPEGLFEL